MAAISVKIAMLAGLVILTPGRFPGPAKGRNPRPRDLRRRGRDPSFRGAVKHQAEMKEGPPTGVAFTRPKHARRNRIGTLE